MSVSDRTPQGVNERTAFMDCLLTKIEVTLSNLYSRWEDEKEHEDFADYERILRGMFIFHGNGGDGSIEFVKATKRPFGMIVKPVGFPFAVHIFQNSRHLGWKSVK